MNTKRDKGIVMVLRHGDQTSSRRAREQTMLAAAAGMPLGAAHAPAKPSEQVLPYFEKTGAEDGLALAFRAYQEERAAMARAAGMDPIELRPSATFEDFILIFKMGQAAEQNWITQTVKRLAAL